MIGIYKITNNINGKVYIGKTTSSIEQRWAEHLRDYQRERCEKRPLYDAFHKYKVDNFSIELIEECEWELLSEREQYWIDYYRSYVGFNDCNGYNATLGGDGKILYDYNEIVVDYQKTQNIAETARNFNCDRDTVKKALKINNVPIKDSSLIIKEKCSKAVYQIDKTTDEVIQIFPFIADAYQALGKQHSGHIASVCSGERKTAYGYKWKYVENI